MTRRVKQFITRVTKLETDEFMEMTSALLESMTPEQQTTLWELLDTRLKKNWLEKIEQPTSDLLQGAPPTPDNMLGLGWNAALNLIAEPLQAVSIAHCNIEIAIAEIRQTVETAIVQGTLAATKPVLKERYEFLAAWLADADGPNRALGGRLEDEDEYYIDLTYAHTLYNATVDYVNGKNGAEALLLAIVRAQGAERMLSIRKTFSLKKPLHATVDYVQIYRDVEELRAGQKLTVDKACEFLAEHSSNAPQDSGTVKRYYYKAKKIVKLRPELV